MQQPIEERATERERDPHVEQALAVVLEQADQAGRQDHAEEQRARQAQLGEARRRVQPVAEQNRSMMNRMAKAWFDANAGLERVLELQPKEDVLNLRKTAAILATGVVVVILAGGQARARAGAAAPQDMPPMPKPGPEHAIFKEDAGTWDAVVESFMPGAPPMTSKGRETNTVGCGGLCLITDFKGEMMPGMSFEGHGISTWDPAKKKYVGSWTDSMSQGLMSGESTWDPATRTATGWMEGPDMTGKMTKMRSVVEYKGGSRVFTMYGPGPDGKEAMTMRITYTRSK